MTIALAYPEYGCSHEFPDDWVFGGAIGADPRADDRWRPTVYAYLNNKLRPIFVDSSSLCDHQAVQEKRLAVEGYFPPTKVYYIQAQRPDGTTQLIYHDIEGALGGSTN